MSLFLSNAQRLMAAAENAPGGEDTDVAVLVRQDGSLHVVMDAGWQAESAAMHYGARTVYRIRRSQGTTRVEGRSGTDRCLLESHSTAVIARQLLSGVPRYRTA